MIHEPTIRCVCDVCGTGTYVVPPYDPDRGYSCDDERVLFQIGWILNEDGEVLCDECS